MLCEGCCSLGVTSPEPKAATASIFENFFPAAHFPPPGPFPLRGVVQPLFGFVPFFFPFFPPAFLTVSNNLSPAPLASADDPQVPVRFPTDMSVFNFGTSRSLVGLQGELLLRCFLNFPLSQRRGFSSVNKSPAAPSFMPSITPLLELGIL
ncbi:hypothetical protein FGO68_gene16707 [Halteria grandinella]|uniref:Uncharacterized protein n=1 Tax=Halteria grandinella TaxID=5974 RepID=A0A8J8P9E5_HALGN|nr:hypothetical protein FGO68_gene16707 [Halteria grandinella]